MFKELKNCVAKCWRERVGEKVEAVKLYWAIILLDSTIQDEGIINI